MNRKPRLIDMLPNKPSDDRNSRRRRLVTQDGTTIAHDNAFPIEGEPVAMDERSILPRSSITFDGAMPPSRKLKDTDNA